MIQIDTWRRLASSAATMMNKKGIWWCNLMEKRSTYALNGLHGQLKCRTPYLSIYFWLVFSTPLKNISQIGSFPQVRLEIKNIWNHHLVFWVPYEKIRNTRAVFHQWTTIESIEPPDSHAAKTPAKTLPPKILTTISKYILEKMFNI